MAEQNCHPIVPPPELVRQWLSEHFGYELSLNESSAMVTYTDIAAKAARWGADQELEACCEWFAQDWSDTETAAALRAIRRPKPPSLKEQALEALEQIDGWAVTSVSQLAIHENLVEGVDTIRRALEALPDD